MFPVSDVIPPRTTPYVTIALLGVNAVLFPAFGLSHLGWIHLFFNMLFLWIFGANVEDRFGHAGFAILYLLCGAIGAAFGVTGPAAVSGIIGAYFVLYPQSRVLTAVFLVVYFDLIEVPAVYFLGVWVLLQLFVDSSLAAHLAAFAFGAGLAVTAVMLRRPRRRIPD